MLAAPYFDYNGVIDTDFGSTAVFNTKQLQLAMDNALFLVHKEKVGVRFSFKKDSLSVKIDDNIELPMVGYDGDDLETGFNPKFLKDIVDIIDDENTTIAFKKLPEGTAPEVLARKPIAIINDELVYVLMPVNLK